MSSPPASPGRVVAERGQLVQAGGGRMRQGPAVPAGREHLAGQHPAVHAGHLADAADEPAQPAALDRKSTRLNSSHSQISYAVFCLEKKNNATFISTSCPISLLISTLPASATTLVTNSSAVFNTPYTAPVSRAFSYITPSTCSLCLT